MLVLDVTSFPADTTFRANQILADQDPVALDYWAAKYILYPLDENSRHHPDFEGIDRWLTDARDAINTRGGLYRPPEGIFVERVTKTESEMSTLKRKCGGLYDFKLKVTPGPQPG